MIKRGWGVGWGGVFLDPQIFVSKITDIHYTVFSSNS